MKKDKGIKKIIVKMLFIVLPFFLYILIELFILPIDFYNFRGWEALIVKNSSFVISGAFYPNKTLHTTEYGDLASYTEYSIPKDVEWETDRYGFRKRNITKSPEIVIIGDSFIAGSGSSQDEILSEVLEADTGYITYPYAPSHINKFLNERRFIENPPKIIIMGSIERDIRNLPELDTTLKYLNDKTIIGILKNNSFFREMLFLYDRLSKRPSINYLIARINDLSRSDQIKYYFNNEPMFFFQGETANIKLSDGEINSIVERLKEYNNHFNQMGIRFIFLPIPNKENLYYEIISNSEKPVFLEILMDRLRKNGIEVIDTQTAFDNAFTEGVTLYHQDDTHWNVNGVKITSKLLRDLIIEDDSGK